MTVKELIEKLQQMDQDKQVEIASEFNDNDSIIEIANDVYPCSDGNILITTEVQ